MIPSLSVVIILTVWASQAKRVPQTNSALLEKDTLNLDIEVLQSHGYGEEDVKQQEFEKQPKRSPRGAQNDDLDAVETQSTFSESYESDFTTPRATQFSNTTRDSGATGASTNGGHVNSSSTERGITHMHNPLYPVTESSYSAYAVMFLSLVVFAVGIVGNLAVMCIVWHNYYMRSAWNYILASLAFWDFLVLCFCLPVVVFNELTNKRLLGEISCRVVPYMEVTSLGVTSFSLCALGIDRFNATTSSQPKTRRVERCHSVLAKLLVIWVGSMVLAAPELLLWQLSQAVSPASGALVDSCTMNPTSNLPESIYTLVINYHECRMWWYFGCYFCLPVVFTLLCQLATCNVSSDGIPQRLEERSPSNKQTIQHNQQVERQLNCTVMALAVVYGICALPENVCNIVLAYTAMPISDNTASLLALINQFFLFFKSSVTPVLLLCLCKSLGQAFMDCCCCCCDECQPAGSSSPGTEAKLKSTDDMSSSIFFDKAKDSSTILSISGSS
ncbi:hypothetical protein UPYG_G00009950 [Umbra pygmaea]|uniref:G-protein coupled receptors family 1 profile domain-containing protein n=1 Tax=Umbra pygmaea TaxID=75934 RepID=A0ABD0XIJ9_UMBPY